MTDPKTRLKGLTNLGAAIDERIHSQTNLLDIKHDAGVPLAAPLNSGGSGGGGGGGSEPVLPESFVESLKADGESVALSGEIVLAATGDCQLCQSASVPHFTIASPKYAAADGVQRVGDEFSCDPTVVRTSGDQQIGGAKRFTDLRISNGSALSWVDGTGSPDVELSRGSTNRLDIADGDGLRLHEWIEAEEIAAPGTPAGGYARRYTRAGAISGSREFIKDDTGCEHELSAQHKQTWWIGQDGAGSAGCNVLWLFAVAPGADGGAAWVTYQNQCTFVMPTAAGDPAPLTNGCGRWSWVATDLQRKMQSLVTLGTVAKLFAGDADSCACRTARAYVRLKVNRRDRFGGIKLTLSDAQNTNRLVFSVQTSRAATNITADDSWQEFTCGAVDIAGWTGPLRMTLSAHGTLESGYLGESVLDVEYFALEQWAR